MLWRRQPEPWPNVRRLWRSRWTAPRTFPRQAARNFELSALARSMISCIAPDWTLQDDAYLGAEEEDTRSEDDPRLREFNPTEVQDSSVAGPSELGGGPSPIWGGTA